MSNNKKYRLFTDSDALTTMVIFETNFICFLHYSKHVLISNTVFLNIRRGHKNIVSEMSEIQMFGFQTEQSV